MVEGVRVVKEAWMPKIFDRRQAAPGQRTPFKADCRQSGAAEIRLQNQRIMPCSDENAFVDLIC